MEHVHSHRKNVKKILGDCTEIKMLVITMQKHFFLKQIFLTFSVCFLVCVCAYVCVLTESLIFIIILLLYLTGFQLSLLLNC